MSDQLQYAEKPVRDEVWDIADQIQTRIKEGIYKSRLPAERLLAEEFDVSRNAIRDALELLETRSIIKRVAGSGSFVLDPARSTSVRALPRSLTNAKVAESTAPIELQVVRSIFEPELVRLAVLHTSPKDVEVLRKIVDEMAQITTEWEAFAKCEENFFLQLARGSGNPLLIAIYEMITDVRRFAHWRAQRQKNLSPKRIKESQDRYRSLFEAIEHRDIDSSVEYVQLQMFAEQRDLTRET
ncbi:MAG: FadR/GntR family transcriptional regulator [Hyphomicrobiales bacterium]